MTTPEIGAGAEGTRRMNDMLRKSAYRGLVANKNYYYPSDKLTEGQIVFRKRMQFARHNSKKLQAKILEAFQIISRVGTGLYRAKNVSTSEVKLLPICQLIRTRLSINDVKSVLEELNK